MLSLLFCKWYPQICGCNLDCLGYQVLPYCPFFVTSLPYPLFLLLCNVRLRIYFALSQPFIVSHASSNIAWSASLVVAQDCSLFGASQCSVFCKLWKYNACNMWPWWGTFSSGRMNKWHIFVNTECKTSCIWQERASKTLTISLLGKLCCIFCSMERYQNADWIYMLICDFAFVRRQMFLKAAVHLGDHFCAVGSVFINGGFVKAAITCLGVWLTRWPKALRLYIRILIKVIFVTFWFPFGLLNWVGIPVTNETFHHGSLLLHKYREIVY